MGNTVFISWSGERSRYVAEALRDWLPVVLESVKPWLSAADVEKGSRWETEIMGKLEEADVGIICLTPGNLDSPWLLFEAGALSKKLGKARVCTYLLDLAPAQVPQPLGMFQHTVIERGETRKLLETINRARGSPIEKDILDRDFGHLWPYLWGRLENIRRRTRSRRFSASCGCCLADVAQRILKRAELAGRLDSLRLRRDRNRERVAHLKARALQRSDAGDYGPEYEDYRDRMAIEEKALKAVEAEIDSLVKPNLFLKSARRIRAWMDERRSSPVE
jgi:hypothetical protein